MEKNMAVWERCARVVIGLGILSLLFWGPRKLWALLGIVPLSTGLTGWCPLYKILGVSTSHRHETNRESRETTVESLG